MKKTIEEASIKHDGDDDSDSSSNSEEKEDDMRSSSRTTAVTLEPCQSSTIDCDKDHQVSAKDDNTLSGVLIFRSCYAARFERNSSRYRNISSTMTSLLADRLQKLGFNDTYNVNIISTSDHEQETYFYYQVSCGEAEQLVVIEQLKSVCKDKNLTDTVTYENQAD